MTKQFWYARAKEPSTWRGLIWLLTCVGMTVNHEQAEAIVATGMALAGFVGVFFLDTTR